MPALGRSLGFAASNGVGEDVIVIGRRRPTSIISGIRTGVSGALLGTVFAAALGCGTHEVPPDANPILAALAHFREVDLNQISLVRPPPTERGVLLVDHVYQPNSGLNSADQIGVDLADAGWSAPTDAIVDMRRRADAREVFETAGLPEYVRVVALEPIQPLSMYARTSEHPDARCWIELWPPGFTRDGASALVRFSIGPAPHVAIATYLLERRDGLWHVVGHRIAQYL